MIRNDITIIIIAEKLLFILFFSVNLTYIGKNNVCNTIEPSIAETIPCMVYAIKIPKRSIITRAMIFLCLREYIEDIFYNSLPFHHLVNFLIIVSNIHSSGASQDKIRIRNAQNIIIPTNSFIISIKNSI